MIGSICPARRVQSMSAVTAEVTKQMMQQWREQIHQSGAGDNKEESAEIEMVHAFNDLTAKVNGRVAFGTSHREVEEVIVLMREMQKLATAAMLDAPILWYVMLHVLVLVFFLYSLLHGCSTNN